MGSRVSRVHVFFLCRQGLFFGIAIINLADCKKGERGSFEDGEKAQLVLGLCGRSRCIRADRFGARGSGGEGRVTSFCVCKIKELFGGFCCTLVEDRVRALTSQSGVRYEGGGHI